MSENYFAFFGLTPAFKIELATLENRFRNIQSEVHPDRFVSGSASEKLQSMQTATFANEAYQALKDPASRAKYLLELQGINATQETNTSMPADFLMQQMEWRENLEEAKQERDVPALEHLLDEMRLEASALQTQLTVLFDEKHDLATATEVTRKLIFIDKVCADIHIAIELLDN